MKARPLHGMFTAVPPRYDLINRVITLGLDRRWRNKAAMTCLEGQPQRILDLACGTGDLVIAIAAQSEEGLELTGLDYSQPMLDIACRKAGRLTRQQIRFVHGDASELPFANGCFDCVGISFAFRNLTYHNPLAEQALAEVLRVLKPGGRFVIVESSQPEWRLIRILFHLYLRLFVRYTGQLLSGNKGAYQYLAESAARFYTPPEVRELLLRAEFKEVAYRPLFFGAAGIHVATKR